MGRERGWRYRGGRERWLEIGEGKRREVGEGGRGGKRLERERGGEVGEEGLGRGRGEG